MSAIKEGCYAWITGLTEGHTEWNGWIVKVGKFLPDRPCLCLDGKVVPMSVWEAFADFLPVDGGLPWCFLPRHLVPINDPDADIRTSDETEGLDDEIGRVRSLAGLI